MKTACYTDIHNQQAMLNYPTVLRKSAVIAAENTVAEFGKTDLYVIGGDTISDYPYWNKSCALAFKNWLDIKKKITENFKKTAKGSKVLYVNGNNDLMPGDLPAADNPPYNTREFYHSGRGLTRSESFRKVSITVFMPNLKENKQDFIILYFTISFAELIFSVLI